MHLTLRPRIDWPFDGSSDDIHEARGAHHGRHLGDGVEGKAGEGRAFVHEGMPAYEVGCWGEGGVVALDLKVYVVDLKVAAGVEVSEGVLVGRCGQRDGERQGL